MNAILAAMVNGAILSALVTAAVWLALRVAPRRVLNAATRYVAWWAVLAVTILLPALYLPKASPPAVVQPPLNVSDTIDIPFTGGSGQPWGPPPQPATAVSPRAPHVSAAATQEARPTLLWPSFPIEIPASRWPSWVFAAWVSVSVLMLIRLIVSWALLQRRKERAFDAPALLGFRADQWLALCGSARRGVRLAGSTEIAIPAAVGPLRPAILIPARILDKMDENALEQIGLHEAAHLARRDDCALLVQRILEAVFAPHLVVRWIGQQIDLEREIACDDFVLTVTGQSRSYASCLTRMVELSAGAHPSPAAAAASSHFARRVESLLDKSRHIGTRVLKAHLTAIVAALAVLVWIAGRSPGLLAFAGPAGLPVPGALLAQLAAPLMMAQAVVQPSIQGSVLEPGSNQPVVGAEVTLEYYGTEQIRMPTAAKSAVTTKSDALGAFAFQLETLGSYGVSAAKEGYRLHGSMHQYAMLTKEQPSVSLRLFLARPARIAGRVMTADTGEPAANVRLRAVLVEGFFGVRRFTTAQSGSTDAKGEFQFSALTAGDYVIQVAPQRGSTDRILTKFSDADWKTVEEDNDPSYWPGGFGQEVASPIVLTSGLETDIGTIALRKVPYSRALIHVSAWDCQPDDKIRVLEATNELGSTPCGQDLLIAGNRPGPHLITLVNQRTDDTLQARQMATAQFTIQSENIETTAATESAIEVNGAVIAADGAKLPDISELKVELAPLEGPRFGVRASTNADGKFRTFTFSFQRQRVTVYGLGPTGYVKEVRYNGTVASNRIVTLERGAMGHTITVVLDDKPSAITGTVKDGDKPVARPWVILARWPLSAGDSLNDVRLTASGDDSGKFRFTGLSSGEYRVVALRSVDDDRYRAPGALEREMASAKRIEVGPNSGTNIDVEVSSLQY